MTENESAVKLYKSAIWIISILAIVSILAAGIYLRTLHSTDAIQVDLKKILVLDSNRILKSSTKQILANKNLSNEQISEISTNLAVNMKKVTSEYQAQGYLVFNSSTLVAFPPALDITESFAEKLGVKLE